MFSYVFCLLKIIRVNQILVPFFYFAGKCFEDAGVGVNITYIFIVVRMMIVKNNVLKNKNIHCWFRFNFEPTCRPTSISLQHLSTFVYLIFFFNFRSASLPFKIIYHTKFQWKTIKPAWNNIFYFWFVLHVSLYDKPDNFNFFLSTTSLNYVPSYLYHLQIEFFVSQLIR